VANTYLSVTIQDSLGVTGVQNIDLVLDGTQTIDDVGSELNTYLPLLDAITDGKILSAVLNWQVDLPGGLKSAPVADTDISRGYLQSWTQATNVHDHPSTLVPAIARTLLDDITGKLNQGAGAWLAWRNHLTGLTGPAITFVSSQLYGITGVYRVVESKRKHRKRTAELSTAKSS